MIRRNNYYVFLLKYFAMGIIFAASSFFDGVLLRVVVASSFSPSLMVMSVMSRLSGVCMWAASIFRLPYSIAKWLTPRTYARCLLSSASPFRLWSIMRYSLDVAVVPSGVSYSNSIK